MPSSGTKHQAMYAMLAEQIHSADSARQTAVAAAFARLRIEDPELAGLALDVLGTEELAGEYFARARGGAERTSGYALLAEGKRDAVANALIATAHGMIT